MEKASGLDLKVFFKQWLYQPVNPKIDATWSYDAKSKKVNINLTQTQLTDFNFDLPIEIGYYIKESKTGSFWALTASSKDDIKAYSAEFKNHYTFYNMDAIPLKSMVRSNPGLILLKNNVVLKKWGAFNLPDPTILKKYLQQ
jgi:aminopeptidase N